MDIALQDSRNLLLLCSEKEHAFVKLYSYFAGIAAISHYLTTKSQQLDALKSNLNSEEHISQGAQERNNHKCLNNKVSAIIVDSY